MSVILGGIYTYALKLILIIKMKVDFQLQSEEGDTGTFIANGEWALLGMWENYWYV